MDQNNNLNQHNLLQNNQQNVSDQTQVNAPVQQPLQPVNQPINGLSKEAEPLGTFNKQEIIHPTEQEPVLAPEVKAVGVENVPNQEQIQIKPELQTAGVEPVKTAVSVQNSPTVNIQMPLTEEEAKVATKTHPAIDSIRWLGTLIIEQSKRFHQKMKGTLQNES